MRTPSVLDFELDLQDAYDRLAPSEKTYAHVKGDVERRYFGLSRSGCPFRFLLLDERGCYSVFPHSHASAFLWGVHYWERDDNRQWTKAPFCPRWMGDPELRKVTGIDFDPTGLQPRIHNLFRGFDASFLPETPPGEVEALSACVHDHVLRVLANGDPEAAASLTDWLAGLLQHPGRMSRVAPVLVGGRANLFMRWVRLSLIGARYSSDVGDDPQCLVNRLFVHVDSRWAVEPMMAFLVKSPTIKELVSSDTDSCEVREVPNYINAVFTTTSELIVRFIGDRMAFPLFMCSNALCGDVNYFDRLETRLADPRVQRAYFQSLMTRPL